jgi:hypothetical protein
MSSLHKFHAVATVIDGVRFASKAEARRYGELTLLQKAGVIKDLVLQPAYPLHARGLKQEYVLIGAYVADFEYVECATDKLTTEDVKGVRTPLYSWKKKHFQAEYGRPIFEVNV